MFESGCGRSVSGTRAAAAGGNCVDKHYGSSHSAPRPLIYYRMTVRFKCIFAMKMSSTPSRETSPVTRVSYAAAAAGTPPTGLVLGGSFVTRIRFQFVLLAVPASLPTTRERPLIDFLQQLLHPSGRRCTLPNSPRVNKMAALRAVMRSCYESAFFICTGHCMLPSSTAS
jgi:hypothetical protein